MESVLITKEIRQRLLPYRQIPTHFGYPRVKSLYKYFYKLDLERFNILVKEPIDCMNFIIEHMIYTDESLYKQEAFSHQLVGLFSKEFMRGNLIPAFYWGLPCFLRSENF